MKITGAQAILRCLAEEGVDTVFGYPGGTVLPLYDALIDGPVRHILTVHEQGAAHAADGYARAGGKTGVCIATSGPGATNLVTGLAAAFMDSVPVVAITGQVPTGLIGRDAFQEVDITGMTMPITKHNFQVKDPAKLISVLRFAFRIARTGRPGPVLVDIPRDIQTAMVEYEPEAPKPEEPRPVPPNIAALIERAAVVIGEAKNPVLVVGGGAVSANAQEELIALVGIIQMPVVSTLMGLGAFPASHGAFLGLTGLHGHKAANNAVHHADVIIAVGSRFNDRVTGDRGKYASGKTVIHIDVDPAEIDKNVETTIGIAGDIKQILRCLAGRLKPGDGLKAWWQTVKAWQREDVRHTFSGEFSAPAIMKTIAEKTAGQSCIFVTDVGQHQMWAAQYLKIEEPRTWLTSGGFGAMGYGLPAAMGAQLAAPDKKVIHIAGDGGFKMTGAELYTIANCELPIISVIINNQSLGMIRQLQHVLFDKRYSSCFLKNVDFISFARAFGVNASTAGTRESFVEAFENALKSRRPELIVADIDPDEMVRPMINPGAALNDYIDF